MKPEEAVELFLESPYPNRYTPKPSLSCSPEFRLCADLGASTGFRVSGALIRDLTNVVEEASCSLSWVLKIRIELHRCLVEQRCLLSAASGLGRLVGIGVLHPEP